MLDALNAQLIELDIQSPQSRQLFKEKSKIRVLPKNENIFLEGKANDSEYLLIRGVLHRYNISEKGDMITTGFYMAKSVITPRFARIKDRKSIFSLQTLTEVVVAEISASELDRMRQTEEAFERFRQKVLEAELSRIFYFETVNRCYGAKERLLILRKHFPGLENLIPHNYIASFLGITNVSFSRLRHELLGK